MDGFTSFDFWGGINDNLSYYFLPYSLQPMTWHQTQECVMGNQYKPCTPKQLNAIAKSITVKVFSDYGWGSGILIKKQGDLYTILTNYHVINNGKISYSVKTADGYIYKAYLLNNYSLQGQDLALKIIDN